MEISIWQAYQENGLVMLGIINTSNQNQINSFVNENSLTFPILFDPGSSGGVQGGDTYDDYYMPNDGSPYPRDFIIDQDGIIQYANNEIDTEWMLYVLEELYYSDTLFGDINQDDSINILDIVILINFILDFQIPSEIEFSYSDLNNDNILNILDIVQLVNIILIN
tara:strand:+ start:1149 stop:1646 length:498 start_codon:yes stop_codon:yes gene_type:complete